MEKAAISLAVAVASPILKKIGEKSASYFGGDVTTDELKDLQTIILPKFRAILRVAERIPVEELKPWLMMLRDACYEAQEVLDMYEYKRLKDEVSQLPKRLKKMKNIAKDFSAPVTLKTELKKTVEKLKKYADEANRFPSFHIMMNQLRSTQDNIEQNEQHNFTSSHPFSPIFGREHDRRTLLHMLKCATNQPNNVTPVIAILGIGGAGKTTFAQLVYNDLKSEKYSTTMWLSLSREFDVLKITRAILYAVTKNNEDNNITSLDIARDKLIDKLKSKPFLLVLDNVWFEDKLMWDHLLIPLNNKQKGSLIIITARTDKVASSLGVNYRFELPELQSEHIWSIFKHYAFGDAKKDTDNPELLKIAEQIVKKLHKSPLAARMVGCTLMKSSNISFWKDTLNKAEMMKDTMDALYLSLQQLPPHLQQCFVFCSLFPKGFIFSSGDVSNLLKFWIAQGYVEATETIEFTLEDKAMQYFNELVSYSFFQKLDRSYHNTLQSYRVHDILHDVAENVSKEHFFRLEGDEKVTIPKSTMHLSIKHADIYSHLTQILELEDLRTFLVIGYILPSDITPKLFVKLRKLRLLHLGRDLDIMELLDFPRPGRLGFHGSFDIMELHKSIGKLKYLRYLKLKGGKKLHKSLGGLYHLQYLNFGKESIYKIPESLNNLINLRILEGHEKTISMIPSLGKLKYLQELLEYSVYDKKQHEIGQLKNLMHLRGSLTIHNLEVVCNKEEATKASLNNKKFLENLSLIWKDSPEQDGKKDEEVLEGLEPHPNLSKLRIYQYRGIQFPIWSPSYQQFSCLSELNITSCRKLKRVPNLPATLKHLDIYNCENLCELPPLHPNLEHLDIRGSPGFEALLSNILLFDDQEEEQKCQQDDDKRQFHLKFLHIEECSSQGKKIFFVKHELFASLSKLELRDLPWLMSIQSDHNTEKISLTIWRCPNLTTLGDFLHLTIDDLSQFSTIVSTEGCMSSISLTIEDCNQAVAFTPQQEDLFQFLFPIDLYFKKCPNLPSLPFCLDKLFGLSNLYIESCHMIESLPNLPTTLNYLTIIECPMVKSLPELPASLKRLSLSKCPNVKSLPKMPSTLSHLFIKECYHQLHIDYKEDGPLRHQISHVSSIMIIEILPVFPGFPDFHL